MATCPPQVVVAANYLKIAGASIYAFGTCNIPFFRQVVLKPTKRLLSDLASRDPFLYVSSPLHRTRSGRPRHTQIDVKKGSHSFPLHVGCSYLSESVTFLCSLRNKMLTSSQYLGMAGIILSMVGGFSTNFTLESCTHYFLSVPVVKVCKCRMALDSSYSNPLEGPWRSCFARSVHFQNIRHL